MSTYEACTKRGAPEGKGVGHVLLLHWFMYVRDAATKTGCRRGAACPGHAQVKELVEDTPRVGGQLKVFTSCNSKSVDFSTSLGAFH